jgi:hypothetical protein
VSQLPKLVKTYPEIKSIKPANFCQAFGGGRVADNNYKSYANAQGNGVYFFAW